MHGHLQSGPPGAKLKLDPPPEAQGAHCGRGACGLSLTSAGSSEEDLRRGHSVPGPGHQNQTALQETETQREAQSRTRPCRAGEPRWLCGAWRRSLEAGEALQDGPPHRILRSGFAGESWATGDSSPGGETKEVGVRKLQGWTWIVPPSLGGSWLPLLHRHAGGALAHPAHSSAWHMRPFLPPRPHPVLQQAALFYREACARPECTAWIQS